jgi:hypothetical protein
MLIRECAPLCLAQDSGWGGVSRGWARIGAAPTMLRQTVGVKMGAQQSLRAPAPSHQARGVKTSEAIPWPPATEAWSEGLAGRLRPENSGHVQSQSVTFPHPRYPLPEVFL